MENLMLLNSFIILGFNCDIFWRYFTIQVHERNNILKAFKGLNKGLLYWLDYKPFVRGDRMAIYATNVVVSRG